MKMRCVHQQYINMHIQQILDPKHIMHDHKIILNIIFIYIQRLYKSLKYSKCIENFYPGFQF